MVNVTLTPASLGSGDLPPITVALSSRVMPWQVRWPDYSVHALPFSRRILGISVAERNVATISVSFGLDGFPSLVKLSMSTEAEIPRINPLDFFLLQETALKGCDI